MGGVPAFEFQAWELACELSAMGDSFVVRFSDEDLHVFSLASGDRNPLHLSPGYASRTAYGQQVVFGALGCIASLRAVPKTAGVVKRITADFQRPMFLHVDYRAEWNETRDGLAIRLLDGSTPVMTTSIQIASESKSPSTLPSAAVFALDTARVLRWEDLRTGLEAKGEYRCNPDGLKKLYQRWFLAIDTIVPETLLWSSYFVGMELPGRDALFFRAALDFQQQADPGVPLRFQGTVSSLNTSLAQVRTAFQLRSGETQVASGQLTAFIRPEMPVLRLSADELGVRDRFHAKVAVVVGASRGLGAASAMTLAAEGAQVIAMARSAANWAEDLPGAIRERITFWQGDAGNLGVLSDLAAMIKTKFGRLDFAIFSAFPAIPSLRLEPTGALRIQEYITRATDLVLGPLCQLLPLLSESNGCAMLISSVAVAEPVRDWPHYMAAKAAAESFFRVAPLQFPETSAVIVRPQRLLTEMTNTPMGRQGATSPLVAARQICDSLQTPPMKGTCEVLKLERGIEAERKTPLLVPVFGN